MKQTLEKQLESDFRFMVKHPLENPDFIDDLYSAFGCECRNGWYEYHHQLVRKSGIMVRFVGCFKMKNTREMPYFKKVLRLTS